MSPAREMTLGHLLVCLLSFPAGDLEPVRIGDTGPHNAFTDLVRAGDHVYCAYREGDRHVYGAEGKIRVLRRGDDSSWRSVALIEKESVDLRDPKLSVTPNGRVMLLCGGSYYVDQELKKRRTQVSFLTPGEESFGPLQPALIDETIRTEVDWLWRVTWHEGVGYGVVYQPISDAWGAHLVSTTDGIHYAHVTELAIDGHPNETPTRRSRPWANDPT